MNVLAIVIGLCTLVIAVAIVLSAFIVSNTLIDCKNKDLEVWNNITSKTDGGGLGVKVIDSDESKKTSK